MRKTLSTGSSESVSAVTILRSGLGGGARHRVRRVRVPGGHGHDPPGGPDVRPPGGPDGPMMGQTGPRGRRPAYALT